MSMGERMTLGCGPKFNPGSIRAALGWGVGSSGQARFLAACARVVGGDGLVGWFCRTCARALLMAAWALVNGVVGFCWSLGLGVLGPCPCFGPLWGAPGSVCAVAGAFGGKGPGPSGSSSSDSPPFLAPCSPFSGPLRGLLWLLLPPARPRCSANSSSLISTSVPGLGTRVAFPWYSFNLSILTTWVPLLLPSFQLGSGVILTMVSYLAGSAHTLQGPVQ